MLHRYDAAEGEFLAALRESPDDPDTNASLGELAVREKQFDKGIPYLEKAVSGRPNDEEAHLLPGRCLLGANELLKAPEELSLAARLNPANARSHYFLAEAYQKLNRPADRQHELGLFNKLSSAAKPQGPDAGEDEPVHP